MVDKGLPSKRLVLRFEDPHLFLHVFLFFLHLFSSGLFRSDDYNTKKNLYSNIKYCGTSASSEEVFLVDLHFLFLCPLSFAFSSYSTVYTCTGMSTFVAATTNAAHWGSLPYCDRSAAKVAAAKGRDGLGIGFMEGVEAGSTEAAAVLRSSSVI